MKTHLIQQKSPNDCTLAAIAMAIGAKTHEEVWCEEDIQESVRKNGLRMEEWLSRVSMDSGTHFKYAWVLNMENRAITQLLWRRPALLSVNSLHNEGGSHAIFWDGERIWDPNEGKEDKIAYRVLTSCNISSVIVFTHDYRDHVKILPRPAENKVH